MWIGGRGLPGGAVGRELACLPNPLAWEPVAPTTAARIAEARPILVILETGRVTAKVRELLGRLAELRTSLDFAVFLAIEPGQTGAAVSVDGALVKGRGIAAQIAAVLQALDAASAFRSEHEKLRCRFQRLRRELKRLRNLVVRDDLTCLYNLRFFNRSLDTEHSRATRFGRQYALIFMDLDGLREVNTRHGHLAGGQVLRRLGEFLNDRLRRIDIPARVGGDEFVIICPETNKVSARILAERLRQGIEALNLHGERDSPGITASIGVASFPDDGDLADQILERADRALYEAKARGKNVVCCWGDFPPSVSSKKLLGSVHNKGLMKRSKKSEESASKIETTPTSR